MTEPTRVLVADPHYEALATRGDNARFTPRPDSFVVATTTAEVVAALQAAVDAGRRVAVRSGGHCYEDFVSDPSTGVVIDLGQMNRVAWDPEHGAVMLEPGVRLSELYRTLYLRWGVTVPGGASATVAAGGHIPGGGYGPLSRRFGTCADHLYAVEVVVVDADGTARPVVATRRPEDPNHELWWALTGSGGGNLGVVTRFWLRSPGAPDNEPAAALPRPPETVLGVSRVFPREGMTREDFRALVGNYSRWLEDNSAPDSPHAGLFSGLVLFGRQQQDDPGLSAILFLRQYDDTPDPERLTRCLAEMTAGVSAPHFDQPVTPEPWLDSMTTLATLQDGTGGRHKVKSSFLRRSYTDEQIDVLYDRLSESDTPYETASVSLQATGCAVNAVGAADNAVPQRDSAIRALYLSTWREESADAANLDWMGRLYRDVYASTGGVPVPDERNDGCYINFPDIDMADPAWNSSGVSWRRLYFGDGLPRLEAAAKTWDPLGVFSHALSIQ